VIPNVLQELALAEEILTVMIEKFPIIFEDVLQIRDERRNREEALDEELDQIRQELENMGTRDRGNTIATTREFTDLNLSPPASDRKNDRSDSIFLDLEESISSLNNLDKLSPTPTDSGALPKTPPPTPRVNLDLSISLSSDTVTTNSIVPSTYNSPHLSSGSVSSQLVEDNANAGAPTQDRASNNCNALKEENNLRHVSVEIVKEKSRQRLREIEDEILKLIDEIEDEHKTGNVEYISLSSSFDEKAENNNNDSLPTTPRSIADDAAKNDDESKPEEAETKATSEPNSPEKFEENNNNIDERKETKEERAARREARRQKRKEKEERKQRAAEDHLDLTHGEAAKNSADQSEPTEVKIVEFAVPRVKITPGEDEKPAKNTEDADEHPKERKRSRSVRIQQQDGSVVELASNSDKSGLNPIEEDEEESCIHVSNEGDTLVVNVKKRKSFIIIGSGSGSKRVSVKEYRVKKLIEEFTKLQEEQDSKLEEHRKPRAKTDNVLPEIGSLNSEKSNDAATRSNPVTPTRDNFSSHKLAPYVPVIQSGPRPTSAKSYVPKSPYHFVPLLSTNDYKNVKGGAKNSTKTNISNESDVVTAANQGSETDAHKVL